MLGIQLRWICVAVGSAIVFGFAVSPSYGTISFLGNDTTVGGDTTDWFNHLNWSGNNATTTVLPPFGSGATTTEDTNGFYTATPTDADIGSSSTGGAGPFNVNFDPANDSINPTTGLPYFQPNDPANTSPPRPLPYGYNDDNNSANGGTDMPAFVIWRLYVSAGENTATNTLNIKSGTLIQRDSGGAGNISANNYGSAGTAQANIGRAGTGIVNQFGGTFINEDNDIDLGQTQSITVNSVATPSAGNGTWNYYGGTLEAGLLFSSSTTAGIRLGPTSGVGNGPAFSSTGIYSTGTMRVYNTGPDGHIRVNNFLIGPSSSAAGANSGSLGTVEFHYGLNTHGTGGVRTIQVDRNLGLDNSVTNNQSARLNLVLDAAPVVTAGVPQNLGLFDNDFDGDGTGGITGATGEAATTRTFYTANGLTQLTQGSTVSATFGSSTYNWTISYTGTITWPDAPSANNTLGATVTDSGTGKDVVLMGLSVTSSLLVGDMNFDGNVDAKDIAALEQSLTNLNGYLSTDFGNGTPSSHGVTSANIGQYADVTGANKFNNMDVQALLNYLLAGHGSVTSVPEPSTFVLGGLGLAALGLCSARRRKAA